METKKLFKKYHSRLVRIGLCKALICSLIVGFAVNFIAAAVLWFVNLEDLWITLGIAIGAGLLALVISMPIFYFKAFRPTTKKVAHQLDRLGLEERIITMNEFLHDESYIAMRQREDAQQKMKFVNSRSLRLHLSKVVIILVCVLAVFGVSMTTVSALAAEGILQPGGDFIEPWIPEPEEEYVMVMYVVDGDEGGFIYGETEQIILKGSNTETVVAIADDGYVFVRWEDMNQNPERTEFNVLEDKVFVAIFHSITMNETMTDGGDEDMGSTEEGGEGQPGESDSSGQGDENGEDNGQDGNSDGTGGESGDTSGGNKGNNNNNKVIDGNTDFNSVFDYGKESGDLASDDTLPPDYKDVVGGYLDSMNPNPNPGTDSGTNP